MPVKASFLGISSKPNYAAIAALVEAARLSVMHKMFGRKTLQFSHVGQSTLIRSPVDPTLTVLHFPDMRLRGSKYIGTVATVLVQIVRNW
jgi:hypothetical protein